MFLPQNNLSTQPSPYRRFGAAFTAATLFCLAFFSMPNHASAAKQEARPSQSAPDSDKLESLLLKLDSSSFQDRESATEELINLGPSILKPLTVHFFNSSSEAGWRIHKIIEGIGKNGQEEDFLRSIAIIRLLFGAQDAQSQKRLSQLQYQWKVSRREQAAEKLAKSGFKFDSGNTNIPPEAAAERARIEMMIRAAAIRDLRGEVHIDTEPDTSAQKQAAKTAEPTDQWQNPRKDRQNSMFEIEKIIANDMSQNREIVEDLLPNELHISLPPGTLEIPENWQADDETLALIRDLSSLSTIRIKKQELSESLLDFLAQQASLKTLELINCQFDDSAEFSLPPSITSLRFDSTIPPKDALNAINQINTLTLSNISMTEDIATTISKCKIQRMKLEGIDFSRETLRTLTSMKGLFQVTMSLCQFKLEWVEDIRRGNPNLISASPKAFLGVQGPIDIAGRNLTGCQISSVVPDTAAADAGMQPLDVVTAMDGNKISRFEDLRLLISQKRPGDSMELEIRRGEETVEITVQLGTMNQ